MLHRNPTLNVTSAGSLVGTTRSVNYGHGGTDFAKPAVEASLSARATPLATSAIEVDLNTDFALLSLFQFSCFHIFFNCCIDISSQCACIWDK